MSRPSSRLSLRYSRLPSAMSRPRSTTCFPEERDMMFEDGTALLRPQTSFHYYPEDEDPELGYGGDYASDPHFTDWSIPEDPEPLKLVKKYGYGYRKPETEVSPHWSQWPQPPASARPQRSVQIDLSPRPCYSARIARQSLNTPGLHTEPGELYNDSYNMNHGDRDIIMSRGLSPRRAAPSRIPGRTLTHYGSFGNRENPNPYIGVLDLHASPYNANRGFNQGITAYTSRQSRPMHRHLTRATKGEEYLHNHSIFYSTTPMATGYFIIHPDWVSERVSLRRSKSLLSF